MPAQAGIQYHADLSAVFKPSHPVKSPWGEGCFSAYLGDDQEQWKAYDASELIKAGHSAIPALIDQGTNDEFSSLLKNRFHRIRKRPMQNTARPSRCACKKAMTTATILLPHSLGSIWLITPRRLLIWIDISCSAITAIGPAKLIRQFV